MAKKKEEKTNVMRILDQRKIPYTARFYEDSQGPEGTREYGVHVAEALGQDPARGFKTLVARGASKDIYVFEVPAPENLDLKKAARAVGEKSIELLHVAEINAVTSYIRGGCSPVGMKKQYPTVFHRTALDYETVYISGPGHHRGQRRKDRRPGGAGAPGAARPAGGLHGGHCRGPGIGPGGVPG